jgi:hypothetical protein
MTRTRKGLLIAGGVAAALVIGLLVAARILAKRFEPYVRQQAVEYLSTRFASQAQIGKLKIHLPGTSPVRLLLTRGRNSVARVEAADVVIRFHARGDIPPVLAIRKLEFGVDLGTLFDSTKHVPYVTVDGLESSIPPKSDQPSPSGGGSDSIPGPRVTIDRVDIRNARLVILPRDAARKPLDFDISKLLLESAGTGAAMKYTADLANPKPPGKIQSKGTFGPWNAEEPGDTPLAGDYNFHDADLSVFNAIAGTLQSTGQFSGTLDSVHARGEARVNDFRLKAAGNPVPLWTRFEVLVDGTNGNTMLKPVIARLGSTDFTTTGGVIKREKEGRKAIDLEVTMPRGRLRDILRLAMKGPPFLEGEIALKTRISIPPLSGRMKEKLLLDGRFNVLKGHFSKATVQDQIDSFSRRAQGRPKDEQIDEVFTKMRGEFHLENQVLSLRSLVFEVPGAHVALNGKLNLKADVLDMHGTLKMQAKVSQTMTGWKRWALKPVDPFFAKNGAGTFLRIQVEGSSKEPKFGRDRN